MLATTAAAAAGVVLVVALRAGDDRLGGLSSLNGATVTRTGPAALRDRCGSGDDTTEPAHCLVVTQIDAIQSFWARSLVGYRPARVTFFVGSTGTSCGPVSPGAGSLYCPRDRRVYVDLAFLGALRRELAGPQRELAQGFVLAHELGHHVQRLVGTLAPDRIPGFAGRVDIELRADCLAGAWLGDALDIGAFPGATPGSAIDAFRSAARVAGVGANAASYDRSGERARWLRRGLASSSAARCT